jgi:putative ABC transport system substrate-binding protein
VLIDPNYQQAEDQARELREAAKALNLQIEIALAGKDQELESAFATLAQSHAAALLITADPFFDTRRDRIIALAAQFRLPAIYQFRDYAVAGGLVSYGVSLADGYSQVGIMLSSKVTSRAICRSTRRSSSSLSLISKPPRTLVFKCRRCFQHLPTR